MKKLLSLFILTAFLLSCSEDDDHQCIECHIAYMLDTGVELPTDIGEFCDDELSDIEMNGYTLMEDIQNGDTTIPAGFYSADMIHCEEHADHDDHDH